VTPDELREELARGRIRPAYLLLGEEALLRDDAVAALREVLLTEDARDFNFDPLPGSQTPPSRLRDATATLPILAPHRLVWLQGLEDRRAAGRDLCEALGDLVPALDGQSGTVLVVTAPKADRRTRWVKAFAEPSAVVACDPPRTAGRSWPSSAPRRPARALHSEVGRIRRWPNASVRSS